MNCVFPLWHRDTRELAEEFIEAGFRGVTTCIDPRRLDDSFAGRELDARFFAELPADCDPCGENGEFHSFVYAGPDWANTIPMFAAKLCREIPFCSAICYHWKRTPLFIASE